MNESKQGSKTASKKATFADVEPRLPSPSLTPTRPTIAPSAERQVPIMIRVSREARDRLKKIAIDRGSSLQQLVIDGINRELAVDGLRAIDKPLDILR